jgi:hypothetical protein
MLSKTEAISPQEIIDELTKHDHLDKPAEPP